MGSQRKILVVIEPDNRPKLVIERATWLAKLMQCDLELLLCDPLSTPLLIGVIPSAKSSELVRAIEQVQEGFVNELAGTARDKGIVVSTEVVKERPIAEAITVRAEASKPAFIVKGTQYHSDAERGIMVDTDWQLVRTSPYPIWLVKAEMIEDRPVIVSAVDPTNSHDKPAALDDEIIRMAKSLADLTNGSVHLFHSYERLAGIGSAAIMAIKPIKLEIDEIDKKIMEEHQKALAALARKHQIDDRYVHQLPGRTSELLPAFVRSNGTQIVVMGALARWGLKRMAIGSTAERVMDHLPCDIVVVRTSD